MLPGEKYDVVLADPPWSYYGAKDKWGAAAKFYDTMSDDEILALDVKSLLKPSSVVFLWATGPRLDLAIRTLASWVLLPWRGVRVGEGNQGRRAVRRSRRSAQHRQADHRVCSSRVHEKVRATAAHRRRVCGPGRPRAARSPQRKARRDSGPHRAIVPGRITNRTLCQKASRGLGRLGE